MKQALKSFLALTVAILIMLAIRAFAFTIYTVPDSVSVPQLLSGDRVWVNRLPNITLHKGDMVVYDCHSKRIGKIVATPGDTVMLNKEKYIIPKADNENCDCADCRIYLVKSNNSTLLVRKANIIGKAFLYRLKR